MHTPMHPHVQARKNAAMFFGSAIHFRAVLQEFDAQVGGSQQRRLPCASFAVLLC